MGKVVAVVGASSDPRKFGNRAVRAFRRQGYTVIPINPNEVQVEGLKAYPSVLDVPDAIDMVTFYVPPDIGEKVIREVASKQIPEVWLNQDPRATSSFGWRDRSKWSRSSRAVFLESAKTHTGRAGLN